MKVADRPTFTRRGGDDGGFYFPSLGAVSLIAIQGSVKGSATSLTLPAHQAGDLIIVVARRANNVPPTVPTPGGTVPTWTVIQSGGADTLSMVSAFAVATASDTTTGVWTNANRMLAIILRGPTLGIGGSSTGNDTLTQTIIYPALTLSTLAGTSWGVRCATRGVGDDEVTNAPAGWTNQLVEPAGASAAVSLHTRASLTSNPTADTVNTTGTDAAYRAHTIEVTATSGGSINFDFTTGSLPAGITFTRASIGTYTNATGTLITAGNDVARLNYVSGVSCLLVEGSATNLLPQSNSFSTAPWAAGNGAAITAAQFVGPDGANTGWSLTSGSGNGYAQQTNIPLLNVQYITSLWAKTIVGSSNIIFYLGGSNDGPVTVTPTLTRLSKTATPPAGTSGPALWMTAAAGGSTNGIFGAQLETGNKATSYIPTTTAAVTRAADSAVLTIPTGVNALLYTFDDGSTQTVPVSAGSYTIPTTLNRSNIKSIVGSA